jgi:hypothetical protein
METTENHKKYTSAVTVIGISLCAVPISLFIVTKLCEGCSHLLSGIFTVTNVPLRYHFIATTARRSINNALHCLVSTYLGWNMNTYILTLVGGIWEKRWDDKIEKDMRTNVSRDIP